MTLDPRTDIGHVHLKVADLDLALRFWHGVLGFDVGRVVQAFAGTRPHARANREGTPTP
jgi:catechol-2,3-dioxygenase